MFQEMLAMSNNGGGTELECLIPAMTSDSTPAGYTAYGSSAQAGSYSYYGAFSGSYTGWLPNSAGANEWVGVSLPDAKIAKKLLLFGTMGGISSNTLKVYGSNDSGTPTNWTLIKDGITLSPSNAIQDFDLDNNTPYKAYKFELGTGYTGSGAFGMKFQLLGY